MATATARTRQPISVVQPPKVIWPDGPFGDPVDVTGLDPDSYYTAITARDNDQWTYERLAAESGRSEQTMRQWVMNAYAAARGETPPNGRVFVLPDGYFGQSPWWRAGRARQALIDLGAMHRDGRSRPYVSSGRKPGTSDLKPRRSPGTPLQDSAPAVLARYRELLKQMSDREARARLCRELGLNRGQVGRRIRWARNHQTGGGSPAG